MLRADHHFGYCSRSVAGCRGTLTFIEIKDALSTANPDLARSGPQRVLFCFGIVCINDPHWKNMAHPSAQRDQCREISLMKGVLIQSREGIFWGLDGMVWFGSRCFFSGMALLVNVPLRIQTL